jgi:hypothetical protein
VERTWQVESAPIQEGSGVMLMESARAAASDRSESWTDDVPSAFFGMQRTVGNRVVQRMVAAARTEKRQPAGVPEADPQGTTAILQPKCACGGTCSACRDHEETDIKTMLHKKTPGKALEPTVRADMEERFGEDFRGVRIHSDAQARDTARQLGADAYTVSKDIFFDAGKYDPTSYQGRRLLAHELTHTVQQTRGFRRSRAAIAVGQVGDRYEREADRLADRVARPIPSEAATGWDARGREGTRVEVQERWRGHDALLSRAVAVQKPASPLQAAGLTMVQVACIKRVYEKAMAMSKPDKWKRCYITAQTASCSLPALQNLAAVKTALNEAIAPADWELLLADPKGLTCRAQGAQAPETCCEEAPAQREKPKDTGSAAPRR